uniref:Uncharacterized protein n=1 Tax=Coccidioides posadasii RMSCC 3488 TaxID=454284 RepID=A0A0J6EUK1_COCPO|nr:hypothetical protein CPAG_00553 [Coccidioides posadasii RMSCC 3488]
MEPSHRATTHRPPISPPIQSPRSQQTSNQTIPADLGTRNKHKHHRRLSHRTYLHAHVHNGLYLPHERWVEDHLIGGEDHHWRQPRGQRDLGTGLDGQREKYRRLRPHRRHASRERRLRSRSARRDIIPVEASEMPVGSPDNAEDARLSGKISEEIANAHEMDNVIRLPFVQSMEYIRQEDVEKERERRMEAEKSNSAALSSIADHSIRFSQRLDIAYYNLLDRLSSIRSTIQSFQSLCELTTNLDTDFNNQAAKLVQETRKQITDFQGFVPQIHKVEALERRMNDCREKALKLDKRLEAVRERIDAWDRKEVEWQKRVSRRLRILWAVMGTVVLLLAAVGLVDHFKLRSASEGLGTTENLKAVVAGAIGNTTRCLDEVQRLDVQADDKGLSANPFGLNTENGCHNCGTGGPTTAPGPRGPEKTRRVLDEL